MAAEKSLEVDIYERLFDISKRFQAGKKISYESFQKFYDLKEVLSFRTKLYMSISKSAGTGGSFRFIFIDKEHMTHEEREIFLALIREKMPQIRNGNR